MAGEAKGREITLHDPRLTPTSVADDGRGQETLAEPAQQFSRHSPRAENWVCFPARTAPLFVLSHYVPMVNTTSNWLCFGPFLSPPVPSLRIHWPLTTGHYSRATRHSPLPPKTLPRWLLPATDRPIAKNRSDPISTSGPSIFSMSPKQAILRTNQSVSPRSPPDR